jgi:hypothetical protein
MQGQRSIRADEVAQVMQTQDQGFEIGTELPIIAFGQGSQVGLARGGRVVGGSLEVNRLYTL